MLSLPRLATIIKSFELLHDSFISFEKFLVVGLSKIENASFCELPSVESQKADYRQLFSSKRWFFVDHEGFCVPFWADFAFY